MIDHLTYQQHMDYVLDLVKKGRLSSPNDLITKFNCTEKTVRNILKGLKLKGYPIKYSKSLKRYILVDLK
jgi:biotin operon repressor